MKFAIALAATAGIAFAATSFAQDQKTPVQTPQAEQGMGGMTMPPDMMARMNKMMDQCEKMMSAGMKGMRHHKGG
jgi:hypothetical protein